MRGSTWLWVLQRASAVLLVGFLGLHLWASNFATDWTVSLRVVVDLALLGLALFHGVNGVRAVVLDFSMSGHGRRFLSAALVVLGLAGLLFGVYGVWPMLVGG